MPWATEIGGGDGSGRSSQATQTFYDDRLRASLTAVEATVAVVDEPTVRVVRLPYSRVAARLARQHVTAVTGGHEDARVALVVTELVTNAVAHADAEPRLRVCRDGEVVRVEVQDPSTEVPVLRPDGDPEALSGRGLAIVDRIADSWGVDVHPSRGKTVWATLTLPLAKSAATG